jgi:hypothetical protein
MPEVKHPTDHPLPIGTRAYYEDYDGDWGTIIHNDKRTFEFIATIERLGQLDDLEHIDYIIDFDDIGPLGVSGGGIIRVAE